MAHLSWMYQQGPVLPVWISKPCSPYHRRLYDFGSMSHDKTSISEHHNSTIGTSRYAANQRQGSWNERSLFHPTVIHYEKGLKIFQGYRQRGCIDRIGYDDPAKLLGPNTI